MNQRDWELLRKLRARFLSATEGLDEYWESTRLLELYDRFFAARIGWKWTAVLQNLVHRGWQPPGGAIIDWGCGTGIAARSFLEFFPDARRVEIWDRSPKAREFARNQIFLNRPGVTALILDWLKPVNGVWLLSHVLNELPPATLDSLLELLLKNAEAVIWIEPGTYAVSRRLIEVRERLRTTFSLVAPCPHAGVCGMLTPDNEPHWCHHFAEPPRAIFHDADWSAFGRELEIDLRSTPYCYLVLDRRPAVNPPVEVTIGRPRIYKGYARLLNCTAKDVAEKTVQKRDDPEMFRQLKKG